MTEAWKPLPSWQGAYEVSDHGRIRSVDRLVPGSRPCQVARLMRGQILKTPTMKKSGYRYVRLSKPGGKARVVYVHHAVLEAFVGPRPEGLREIRHLNGTKADCRLTNLRYGTTLENAADRKLHAMGLVAA